MEKNEADIPDEGEAKLCDQVEDDDKTTSPTTEKTSAPPTGDPEKKTEERCPEVESSGGSVDSKSSANEADSASKHCDEANLHYEDGICIYTDPDSKCQYVWDETKQEWVPRNPSSSFSDKDYEFDGKVYTYTDKETNIKYGWNDEKQEWLAIDNQPQSEIEFAKNETKKGSDEEEEEMDADDEEKPKEIKKQDMSKGKYGFENGTHTYTDPSDGSVYFWDKEKNAWFPKVDDDFLAQYQMNYGFVDPNEEKPSDEKPVSPPPPPPTESLKRKAPSEPTWFEVGQESTKVYVSGLPLDITETEFVDLMQKCGLVMRDLDTGKMKIKIYLDPETSLPKGDALCTYIKKESVELALDLLDGSDVRGHRIQVERAKFTMKGGAYDPALKPKKKRKKDKEKLKKMQEKLFDWRPDKMRGERPNHEKTVTIKNLFDPVIFNKDVKLILEYQQDLREECLKCGSVKKVIIYDRHPEGVAQVVFKEFEAADACIQLLNNRWFGQRQITAQLSDGKTRYKISETDEEIKARMAKWEKFLESEEGKEENKNKDQSKDVQQPTKDGKDVKETNESGEELKETNKSGGELKETNEPGEELKDKTLEVSGKEFVVEERNEIDRDSDGTRSSGGSDYDTDDEAKTNKN